MNKSAMLMTRIEPQLKKDAEEFEQRLRKSLAQAKAGMGEPAEQVFAELKAMCENIKKGR